MSIVIRQIGYEIYQVVIKRKMRIQLRLQTTNQMFDIPRDNDMIHEIRVRYHYFFCIHSRG